MSRFRVVRKEGGSRVLSVREIPPDWKAVDVELKKSSKDSITLKIDKVK